MARLSGFTLTEDEIARGQLLVDPAPLLARSLRLKRRMAAARAQEGDAIRTNN